MSEVTSEDILSPNAVAETPVETPEAPVQKVTEETPKSFTEDYVKELREEAAKHRTEKQAEKARVEKLEKELQEFRDSQLSAEDRAKKEFEETRTRAEKNEVRARELEIKYQLALAAVDPQNQIGDVKAAIKLLDRDSLEFDDNGKITNLQGALEALKAEYPSVVASKNAPLAPSTGATNPPSKSETRITRESLAKMSPEQITELNAAGKLNHLLRGGK